jgi:hypothetical protein
VKYMNFTQTISFRTEHEDEIVALAREWDEMQAEADVMGYIGSHVLRDRDSPGHYVIVAEFAVVDPNVSAVEEAMKNNDRPITQEWARRMREMSDGSEPEWGNYDEIYRTG